MKTTAIGLLMAFATACAGCSPFSIAKQAGKELIGARGKTLPIRDAGKSTYASFHSVKLGQVTSDIGGLCPAKMTTALAAALRKELGQLGSGSPSMTADFAVTYYETGGVISKHSTVVTRAILKGEDGTPVSDLLVVAHSEAMHTGDEDMAKAIAKAFADHLKRKLPKGKG